MARVIDWLFDRELGSTVILGSTVLVLLLAMGAVFVHEVEGWGWVDSVYFIVTAVTTLGSSFVPQHEITKIFLIVWLPVGIGVGFTVLASIGAAILDAQRRRLRRFRAAVGSREGHGEGQS
ncbi:MAG TPA: two pore domain potassium channel family protein [Thermoplasmata archaeon]|nr:two pore domain potassium channel family protein [Thermoplasmata archaeon]